MRPTLSDLDLKLSPEVAWYLQSRGIARPTCPPKIKTPEPCNVRGAMFDPERVDRVIASFRMLRHTQGDWGGKPLEPDPWQVAYIIAPIFGWVKRNAHGDMARIIRKAYVDIPRKNGKTTTAGGIGTYLTGADEEPGAQVLAAAAGKDQAKFCFDPIKNIVEKSPALGPYFKTMQYRIIHKPSGSYFTVVSALADLLHGANVHGAVVDELHVHKTPDLLEAIETGTGSRRQPLVLIITTADDGRQVTVYARRRDRIEQLARGAIRDPSMYGVVWAAEPEDDPFAESTWKKANPGYGISPTREFMAAAALEAEQSPADLAKFLRLHLGIRTKQETKYLTLDDWDRNASIVDPQQLKGREAWGGLDLAATSDLSALGWIFPDGDALDCLWRFWTPEENVARLDKVTAGEATVWVKQGWLTVTPGNVADYELIRSTVAADLKQFDVRELAYDPWNAMTLVQQMQEDGAPLVEVRQGPASLSAALKEMQRLTRGGTAERPLIRHGGNPVMRWMVDNLAVHMDTNGNVKPDKAKSADKIDGVSAFVTALSRQMVAEPPAPAYRFVNF